MLSRFFRLHENGTTVGRELQAGLTTFAAMAYVLAVNPSILVNAGMDRPALVTITALSAAVATALMANSHTTVVVATGVLRLAFHQACQRLALVETRIHHLDQTAATRRGGFDLDQHYAAPPSTKLISWPGFRQTNAFFQPLR
jgi:ABC-type branched-subunit amino acid transport system ATPase component